MRFLSLTDLECGLHVSGTSGPIAARHDRRPTCWILPCRLTLARAAARRGWTTARRS